MASRGMGASLATGQAPLHSVHFSPLDMHSEAGVSDSWCSPPPGAHGTEAPRRLSQQAGESKGSTEGPGEKRGVCGAGASWGGCAFHTS